MKIEVTVEVPEKETCIGCRQLQSDIYGLTICRIFGHSVTGAGKPCAECLAAREGKGKE